MFSGRIECVVGIYKFIQLVNYDEKLLMKKINKTGKHSMFRSFRTKPFPREEIERMKLIY